VGTLLVVSKLHSNSGLLWAQLIRLRHPETSPTATNLFFNPALLPPPRPSRDERPPFAPGGPFSNDRPPGPLLVASQEASRRRRPPPGAILVRFDSKHNIRRVQYVLQDGQLATVYSKRAKGSKTKISPAQSEFQLPPQDSLQAQSSAEAQPKEKLSLPEQHSLAQQGQQQQEQQLVEEPENQLIFEPHQFDEPIHEQKTGVVETQFNGYHEEPLLKWPKKSETGEILAAIARDSIASQKDNFHRAYLLAKGGRLTKFGKFMKKLRKKIRSKLKQSPKSVQSKLGKKSSDGKLFVDRPDGRPIPIELQGELHQHLINNPFDRFQLAE